MASALYRTFGRRMMAPAQCTPVTAIDLSADTIRACFVAVTGGASLYTFAQTHEFFSDVTNAAVYGNLGQSSTMANCPTLGSITSNTPAVSVFDAADTVFTAPVLGTNTNPEGDALIIFKSTTTVTTTSPLIAYIDGFSAVGFNGGSVTVQWDAGANAIFKLIP